MALHPAMVEVLTGCDAAEQDIIERLCRGDWDRVTFEDGPDGTRHVLVGGRRTVFEVEPEDDPDLARYFVDGPEVFIDLTDLPPIDQDTARVASECLDILERNAQDPFYPHVIGARSECHRCGERQAVRGARCPAGPPEMVVDSRALIEEQRVVLIEDSPVVARDSTPDAQTGGLEPVTPAATGGKQCGYVECEEPAPTGKYCSVRCQRRQAQHVRKTKGDRAPGRKAAATDVRSDPVVEPEPQLDEQVNPEPAVEVPLVGERRVWCARCEREGHYVEECPQPMTRRKKPVADLPVASSSTPVDAPVEDASQRSVREARDRLARSKKAAKQGAPEVIVCGRCKEKGHSIFTCSKPADPVTHLVRPPRNEPLTDDELTAHSASLQKLCGDGLPEHFQYSYKDDVLALYGIDTDLMDAALRSPERVEVRPEGHDKEKRYCILAFYRGDLEVILGMRNPAAPMVIAAYATSRLEHDTHRVGHTGGGGSKSSGERGLPKTSRAVAQRLRSLGAEVEIDALTGDYTDVTFKGQNLGKISCNGDRKTCEQDFQRVQRKIAAIERRVAVNA